MDKSCDRNYSGWEPIIESKKLMKEKVIFESEEELDYFVLDIIMPFFKIEEMTSDLKNRIKEKIKQKGYIRKSALEEAEEMYKGLRYDKSYDQNYLYLIMNKQYSAIQELKSEIERLKNEIINS